MKKKIIRFSLIGAPIGVTIGILITILISLIYGDGNYYPVVPELIGQCGSEVNAVLVQTVCTLIYGAMWGGASVVWEIDEWSILRQTLTHLLVTSVGTFPFAWLMYWMQHSVTGALGYFGIYFLIYFGIWAAQYGAVKKRLKQINKKLKSV